MKKFLIIFLSLLLIGGIFVYKFRTYLHGILVHCHQYHELKYRLFPDKYDMGTTTTRFYYEEERLGNGESELFPKWWFRSSSAIEVFGHGLVCDNDNDGIPEVYIAEGSKYIYCIDGVSGKIIWKFTLPLGVAGTLVALLEDVDNDGTKELIIGTICPLPIRVYCLSTKRDIQKRVIWHTNVSGDFLQGGLISFRNRLNQVRIIAATRDAPYSRGTLNVLDATNGKHLYPPIYGVDVCNHRPSIADINKDGYLEMVIGSHKFYGAKYGFRVTAFMVETGQSVWSIPVEYDTGFMQFPILDIDNDGRLEILTEHAILNAVNGEVLFDFNKKDKYGVEERLKSVLFNDNRDFIYLIDYSKAVDYYSGKVKYEFNNFPRESPDFFLDLDQNGSIDFLTAYLVLEPVPQVQFYLFDARKGRKKAVIIKKISTPVLELMREDLLCQQEQRDYFSNGPTQYWKPGYKKKTSKFKDLEKISRLDYILADVDGDGYWEALVNFNSTIFCFDLPFAIPEKYESFRYPRLKGDPLEDQSGFNYDLSQRAFERVSR